MKWYLILNGLVLAGLLGVVFPVLAQDAGNRPVITAENATQIVELRRMEHVGSAYDLSWSPDSRFLASSGGDMAVRIWDAQTGSLIRALTGHQDIVRYVVWSPDGTTITSASDDNVVRVWDANTGALIEERSEPSNQYANPDAVRFSPDRQLVALFEAWTSDGVAVDKAQGSTGTPLLELLCGTHHDPMSPTYDTVIDIEWSPDGTRLATTVGEIVQVWGLPTAEDTAAPATIEPAPGASISLDNAAQVNLLYIFDAPGISTGVVWSPDGAYLAYANCPGCEPDGIHLFDVTRQATRQIEVGAGITSNLAFSPDGSLIAAAVDDRTVRLWDVATGEVRRSFKEPEGLVTGVAFSPDGAVLATSDEKNQVMLWNAATGEWLLSWAVPGQITAVPPVFSLDGVILVTGGEDQTVRLWKATTGELLATLEGHAAPVLSLAFSRDGTVLASGDREGTIRLWNSATWEALRVLTGHFGFVEGVAFNYDGTVLASASTDATVILWDVAAGLQLSQLWGDYASPTTFHGVAFSPDGTLLASITDFKGWVWGLPVSTEPPLPSSGTLVIGGLATVHVINNDTLNVRESPALSAAILEKLPDGVAITLLEGPLDAEGYTWWRIATPGGIEGWVVSYADGVQTLVP